MVVVLKQEGTVEGGGENISWLAHAQSGSCSSGVCTWPDETVGGGGGVPVCECLSVVGWMSQSEAWQVLRSPGRLSVELTVLVLVL